MLVVEDVAIAYRNGALGIDGVSLRVGDGQVVALLGPNGAGKTTTVRGISGFLRAEGARVVRGSVEYDGHRISGLEPHQAASRGIAFVPERHKVFPNLSVAENLAVRGRTKNSQRLKGLYEEVWSLFPVLAERQRTLAGRLSGGQQQMLAIAHAILSDPKLLIIDEMTLGLHPVLHEPLFDSVTRLSQRGTALIIVDESTDFALHASDYCYILSGGRVRAEGPSSEFDVDRVAETYVHAH